MTNDHDSNENMLIEEENNPTDDNESKDDGSSDDNTSNTGDQPKNDNESKEDNDSSDKDTSNTGNQPKFSIFGKKFHESYASTLSPPKIVQELNRFIIGQEQAKKSVAIALRNRWRRNNVGEPMRNEIIPKNILMVGATGIGKTEIARRLASISGSPFIKVDATKFTEIGYVGRDVDSIIRDLTELAINMVRERMRKEVISAAYESAERIILKSLVGENVSEDTLQLFKKKLHSGELDKREIEIEIKDDPNVSTFDVPDAGNQMGMINVNDMLNMIKGKRTKKITVTVAEARKLLIDDEADKLLNEDKIKSTALDLVSNEGIVVIDEIDKISARSEVRGGEVNREGVQRELLPLLEGTTVNTKYGTVKTDYILFIASGAFHLAKPSDLLPELQGRLPIRVELHPLDYNDMMRILKEPESSLLKQYIALMKTEEVELEFAEDGIEAIVKITMKINREVENIGVRRFHTVLEKLLEEVSFHSEDHKGKKFLIDEEYVQNTLKDITQSINLEKFIL